MIDRRTLIASGLASGTAALAAAPARAARRLRSEERRVGKECRL